jgi:hypothetical protein
MHWFPIGDKIVLAIPVGASMALKTHKMYPKELRPETLYLTTPGIPLHLLMV